MDWFPVAGFIHSLNGRAFASNRCKSSPRTVVQHHEVVAVLCLMFLGTLVSRHAIVDLAFEFTVVTFDFACHVMTNNVQSNQTDGGLRPDRLRSWF